MKSYKMNRAATNPAASAASVNRKSPRDNQIIMLCNKPCSIKWSDGRETRSTIGDVFYTEEAYKRYLKYKRQGHSYPVEVQVLPLEDPTTIIFPDDPEGEKAVCDRLTRGFNDSLKRFVVDAD